MTASMPYRGPDGIHHWRKGNVALGHCMMHTTPESLEETQPLTNQDESLVLVMDGRVDNWEELRRELLSKGAVLRTQADAELVLRAYEVWGRECLGHIEGDFALVIWDAQRQEAFCARDRAGSRRFHYHWNGQMLVFATDVQAVLSMPWVPQIVNDGMVVEHLANEWHSLDETLWQGVLRLVPAHRLVARVNGLQIDRYWLPDMHATVPCRSDGEYIEYYRALFTDVVRRMSRSNHPVACDVSGGLDSSAIFAVAERLRQDGRLPAPGLEGYALDFSGDPHADELVYSRAVGTHLGRTIHEIAPAHMPLDWFREHARRYRDLPEYPNGTMSLSIAEAARAHGCRVWLNGLGGDEWVGGSRVYYAEALAGRRGRELIRILRADAQAVGMLTTLRWFLRSGLPHLLTWRLQQVLRSISARGVDRMANDLEWLSPAIQAQLVTRRQAGDPAAAVKVARVGQRRQIDLLLDGYLGWVREFNELQPAYMGLEQRRPFYDARIIQAAFATPEHVRRRGLENKWMHRQAMTGLLPEDVLRRASKADFGIMASGYRHGLVRAINDDILPRRGGWVSLDVVRRIIHAQKDDSGHVFGFGLMWTLFTVDAVVSTA